MLKTMRLVLAGFLLIAAVWAADITGKWTAEMQGPQGTNMTTSFNLKADGNTLTGTVQGMRGRETPISDGKIDGDNVSFSVVREFRGNQTKMNYKGKINGDSIHFTVTRDGGDGQGREFDAKRAS
jgi:hypothetical protein